MKIPSAFLALGFLLCSPACDINIDQDSGSDGGDTDGGGSGATPPSDASVSSCRDACDGLQFFDCIDGNTHETCWNACPNRADDDLELFASCVMNSLPNCDPDCLDGLLDAPEPAPDPDPTTDGSSGTTTCEDACQAYVDAGCDVSELSEAPSCAQACGSLSPDEQDLIAGCLNSPQTCEINPLCFDGGGETGSSVDETGGGGGGGGSVSCQFACDDLLFYDCLTPVEHSECYDVCDSATGNDADAFVSCVSAVLPVCDPGCYEVFVG